MNLIKNIRLLEGLPPDRLQLLEQACRIHKAAGGISFKVIGVDGDKVTIRIMQERHAAGNYHPVKRLVEIVRETFGPFVEGKKILVHPLPYVESPATNVDSAWINKKMLDLGVKIKEIAQDTGLNRSQVNALVTGNRPLSQSAKALMYFYFQAKEAGLKFS